MGRSMDRKWTDEQRDTVLRAVLLRNLSHRAAGELVSDSDGRPMPKGTVRGVVERGRETFMLRDTSAARQRVDQELRDVTYRMIELSSHGRSRNALTPAQRREVQDLQLLATGLKAMRAALGPERVERPAGKAAPKLPAAAEDPAVTALLNGAA